MRGLLGNVGYVGVWVAWVRGCVGYVGQNIFYVGCVGQFFLSGLRGSNFLFLFYFIFAWVSFYLLDEVFLPYYN